MGEELTIRLWVLGIMVGIPLVLWVIQNRIRRARGQPPAPVGKGLGAAMGEIDGAGDPGTGDAPDAGAPGDQGSREG